MSEFLIDEHLDNIYQAAQSCDTVIVKAEPGVGKTTRLPLYFINKGVKKVLVVEPRRVAAKLPATYIAQCLGEKVGATSGYKVRYEHVYSSDTKLLFMTDGMLVKHLGDRNFLGQFEYIIFDEFHERSLNADLAFSIIQAQKKNRRDQAKPFPKTIFMSATIDVDVLFEFFPEASVFDIKGNAFAVKTTYAALDGGKPIEVGALGAVRRLERESFHTGNTLIFLTGKAEISKVSSYLRENLGGEYEVIELMSANANKALAKINADTGKRKIICATNVAETSVTLPQITGVIDSGTHFQQQFAPWNGLPYISKKKISQDSAIQRTGRAGRVAAGGCVRLFAEADFIARERFTQPEVVRADLTGFIIDGMNAVGSKDLNSFLASLNPLTPLPEEAVDSASKILKALGFLSREGAVTPLASVASSIPVHPRLAAIIIKSEAMNLKWLGVLIAALVEEGGVLRHPSKPYIFIRSDYVYQLELLCQFIEGNKIEDKYFLKDKAAKVLKLASKLGYVKSEVLEERVNRKAVNEILLAGFPDRVVRILPKFKAKKDQAKKKGETFFGGQFMFCLGNSANLAKNALVQSETLMLAPVASEMLDKGRKQIFLGMASGLEISELLASENGLLTKSSEVLQGKSGDLYNIEKTFYGEILLDESKADISQEELKTALLEVAIAGFPNSFEGADSYERYLAKLDYLDRTGVPHELPRLEGDFLELAMDILVEGKSSSSEIFSTTIESILNEFVSYESLSLLSSQCPDQIKLANGVKLEVTWTTGSEPEVHGIIQNFFGLKENPVIGTDKVAPRFVLLAPNNRPAQVTADLVGFFKGGYFELAKELSRRYPKHYWPDGPAEAKPFKLKKHVK